MLTHQDNEMLTRTGTGTPMGELFRRFWQPVALSRELPENDGPPIRVQLLGEHLVAFRDTQGRVGLVEPKCPHRGADLFYGRNEECGLRCVFHGWKFDVNGKAVDLPIVPSDSTYHEKISIRAYPTREFGEIIWAWLGPKDSVPEVPQLDFGTVPASHRYVTKKLQECNWAQAIEGALDTSHFSFLHMPAPSVPSNENPDAPADERRLRWIREDPMPRFSILEHDVGFVVGGARRTDSELLYWRSAQFAMPSHSTTPSTLPGENHFGYTFVPIDDENCWIYTYVWNPERPLSEEERAQLKGGHGVVAEVDENFRPLRNRSNEYMINRVEQKTVSFTGVRGVAEQDALVQESMGRIADRTIEHLTTTDAAVVRFRRTMLKQAKDLAAGTEPSAPRHHEGFRLRSGSWMANEGVPFEDVMRERFGDPVGRVVAENETVTK
jgi:phenylpropionate dioxygenase-like ring-hydroxylating dioxygenase large terminal subunit